MEPRKILVTGLLEPETFLIAGSSISFTTAVDEINKSILTDSSGNSKFPEGGQDIFISSITMYIPEVRGLRGKWLSGTSRNGVTLRVLKASDLSELKVFNLLIPDFETVYLQNIRISIPNIDPTDDTLPFPEYVLSIEAPVTIQYDNNQLQPEFDLVNATLALEIEIETIFSLEVL